MVNLLSPNDVTSLDVVPTSSHTLNNINITYKLLVATHIPKVRRIFLGLKGLVVRTSISPTTRPLELSRVPLQNKTTVATDADLGARPGDDDQSEARTATPTSLLNRTGGWAPRRLLLLLLLLFLLLPQVMHPSV